uniref:START domain-containing protein n=1 Tax=Pyramimonas obovata TaxID=1411642 RepID=A0A7S0WV51_9CHLO|mmetsp:Transcript_5736/g.11718  ORF Transcript_5736/g.11718 Transcript_5736/m.11718 type:complete len:452 (+) Transcript_5736:330-1685(+)
MGVTFELLDLSLWLNYLGRSASAQWGSGILDHALAKQSEPYALLLWLPVIIPLVAFAFVFLCRALLFKVAPPGVGVRRLWIAFSAAYAVSSFWRSYTPHGTFHKLVSYLTGINWLPRASPPARPTTANSPSLVELEQEKEWLNGFTYEEVNHFKERVSSADAEIGSGSTRVWEKMCQKRTEDIDYVAWRHILPDGGTEYFSKTIVENASAELMATFYNNDESRLKWDGLLADAIPVDVDGESTTEAVYWVRKFPVACGPRDYVFGRRSWLEKGDQFYTITKGIKHASKPVVKQPQRVEKYYSSWLIRPVEGRLGQGKTAVETTLIHYEDMGIPNAVARFAVRQGMWGVVKNLCRGYREFELQAAAQPRLLRPSFEVSAAQLCPLAEPTPEEALLTASRGAPKRQGKLRQRAAVAGRVVGLLLLGSAMNSARRPSAPSAAKKKPRGSKRLQH